MGKDASPEAFLSDDEQGVNYTGYYSLDDAVMFYPEQDYYGCEGKERKGAKGDFAKVGVDGVTHDE